MLQKKWKSCELCTVRTSSLIFVLLTEVEQNDGKRGKPAGGTAEGGARPRRPQEARAAPGARGAQPCGAQPRGGRRKEFAMRPRTALFITENTVRQPFAITAQFGLHSLIGTRFFHSGWRDPHVMSAFARWECNREEPGLVAPTELAL